MDEDTEQEWKSTQGPEEVQLEKWIQVNSDAFAKQKAKVERLEERIKMGLDKKQKLQDEQKLNEALKYLKPWADRCTGRREARERRSQERKAGPRRAICPNRCCHYDHSLSCGCVVCLF